MIDRLELYEQNTRLGNTLKKVHRLLVENNRDRQEDLEDHKEDLGQIYTPSNIASFMSLLLLREQKGRRVLDPCIGENIFFKSIEKLFPRRKIFLQGIEVDPNSDRSFFKKSERRLWEGNFFDFPEDQLYDYIIMNPPYVRQEDLFRNKVNNKEKIRKSIGDIFSSRANLYVYFFAKAVKQLKPGGKLVAICYDSWLFTEFGEEFKIFLKENFSLDTMVHIRNSAFDNASVGATILELTKGRSGRKPVRLCIEDKNEIPMMHNIDEVDIFLRKNDIFRRSYEAGKKYSEQNGLYTTIGNEFQANRGLETPANKYFYLDAPNLWTRPVIKNPKMIGSYTVSMADLGSVFMAPPTIESLDQPTRAYLKTIERQAGGYETLSRLIAAKPQSWFSLPEPPRGNIVFNYYLRDRVDFIYNPKRHIASNNFYIINSPDPFLHLTTLNSSLIRGSILSTARDQGDGLKKVQLYEFRNLLFPRLELLSDDNKKILRNLGKQLVRQPRGRSNSQFMSVADRILGKTFGASMPLIQHQNVSHALV